MGWLVCVAVAAVGVPIGWFLLKTLVGFCSPPHISGKALLKQELKKHGVDPVGLGDACLSEITQTAIGIAQLHKLAGRQTFIEAFVKCIEDEVVTVVRYLQGAKPDFDGDPIYDVLRRHSVLS